MKRNSTHVSTGATGLIEDAWQDVGASFERFCLTTGIATLSSMLESDAAELCGLRHGRDPARTGHRWGRTQGKIGFHGGRVSVDRPRVRSRDGGEVRLASWEAAQAEARAAYAQLGASQQETWVPGWGRTPRRRP
jgi:hypothetical protein